MNPFLSLSLGLALVLAAGAPARAAAPPKIATADLKKLFDGYWKTRQANAGLKDLTADMNKERSALADKLKNTNDEYKKLLESANDQAVSAEEREKRKKAAEEKLLEIRQIEMATEQFIRNANANLSEQERRMRDNIVKELRDAVNARAKAAGFTLVLDSSGETSNSAPSVLFTNGENDLTEALLAELNAKAPPEDKPREAPPADDKPKDEKKKEK